MIYTVEGGIKRDGTTVAGITSTTLGNAQNPKNKYLYVRQVVGRNYPDHLNDDQRLLIYCSYFDDALLGAGLKPGHLALDGIGDPRTAVMVGDPLFRDGSSDGAKLIHQALDQTIQKISSDEVKYLDLTYNNERIIDRKKQDKKDKDVYDYYVGGASYRTIQTLVQQGQRRRVPTGARQGQARHLRL
jgi:hypothetical protein